MTDSIKEGEHYICISKDHPILRYGYIYTTTSGIQGNGLVRLMAYELSTEYAVKPKHLREVPLHMCTDWRIKMQSKEWEDKLSSN